MIIHRLNTPKLALDQVNERLHICTDPALAPLPSNTQTTLLASSAQVHSPFHPINLKSTRNPVCVLFTLAVPQPFCVGSGMRLACMSCENCANAAATPSRFALGGACRAAVASGAAGGAPDDAAALSGCLEFDELVFPMMGEDPLMPLLCRPLEPLVAMVGGGE